MTRFIPGVTDAGKPRAAVGGFPYPGHRTFAEVMQREQMMRERAAYARQCLKAKRLSAMVFGPGE